MPSAVQVLVVDHHAELGHQLAHDPERAADPGSAETDPPFVTTRALRMSGRSARTQRSFSRASHSWAMDTFLVLLGLLALIELGVALGWAHDSRDGRDRWPFGGHRRHDGE